MLLVIDPSTFDKNKEKGMLFALTDRHCHLKPARR
jgi:hypothetical protein